MTAPGMRKWSRHLGPQIGSGSLVGAGIALMLVTQVFFPAYGTLGFALGILMILVGGLGIVLLK